MSNGKILSKQTSSQFQCVIHGLPLECAVARTCFLQQQPLPSQLQDDNCLVPLLSKIDLVTLSLLTFYLFLFTAIDHHPYGDITISYLHSAYTLNTDYCYSALLLSLSAIIPDFDFESLLFLLFQVLTLSTGSQSFLRDEPRCLALVRSLLQY